MTPESLPSKSKVQEPMDYRVTPLRVYAIGVKKGKKAKLYYAKWKNYSVEFPEGERIALLPPVAGASVDVGMNIIREALEQLNDIFTGQDIVLRFSVLDKKQGSLLRIEAFRWDGELVGRAFIAPRTDLDHDLRMDGEVKA